LGVERFSRLATAYRPFVYATPARSLKFTERIRAYSTNVFAVTDRSSAELNTIDPRFTNRERQPGLDLLRALAVIVVVIYHAGIMGFPLPGRIHRFGWIGVDLFFVLSGYLIGGQLLKELARTQELHLGRFFARRALRILPAYLVILGIYVYLPAWREYPEMSPSWKFLISAQNIGLHGGTAFSHAWSLAVEDQFYLILPSYSCSQSD
jgi:peptidoglycan/LPS O-acetylase OafA/YrhL